MTVLIRAITADEWSLWRDLRLRALADSPDAFRPTFEEESVQPDEWWEDIIGTTAAHPRGGLWLADLEARPVGMAFGRLDSDRHVLNVAAMWVAPGARGRGVGRRLLEVAMDWATESGATIAELWVTEGNEAAESLYRKAGFRSTGETDRLRPTSELTISKLSARLPGSPGART